MHGGGDGHHHHQLVVTRSPRGDGEVCRERGDVPISTCHWKQCLSTPAHGHLSLGLLTVIMTRRIAGMDSVILTGSFQLRIFCDSMIRTWAFRRETGGEEEEGWTWKGWMGEGPSSRAAAFLSFHHSSSLGHVAWRCPPAIWLPQSMLPTHPWCGTTMGQWDGGRNDGRRGFHQRRCGAGHLIAIRLQQIPTFLGHCIMALGSFNPTATGDR